MEPAPNRLSRLPAWLSHWLGYRAPGHVASVKSLPLWLVSAWSFVGAFSGLSVLQAVFGHDAYFIEHAAPPIVASYGASAVLCYGAIEVPFSQPRALVGGHFLSALVGVCITKLFHLLPPDAPVAYVDVAWVTASLAAALSIVVMQTTATTHPPAGATALLPATNPQIAALGWYFLPVVLLSSTLVLASALLLNNVQRRYPIFWWAPTPLPLHATPKEPDEGGVTPGESP